MVYDYLGLVNNVIGRVNETPLTTSNFAAALGHYTQIKEAVNTAIRQINQDEFEWPFNYDLGTETCTAGTNRYEYPYNCKTINFDSFRVQRDSTLGNETVYLNKMDYEEYLEKYVDYDYNDDTSLRSVPRSVIRTPNREFILLPTPDAAYSVDFDYYRLPVDLENPGDVPAIPEQFRNVIIDGAMYHVNKFRGDDEAAVIAEKNFEQGIKNMRKVYINRYEYVRSGMIPRKNISSNYRNVAK